VNADTYGKPGDKAYRTRQRVHERVLAKRAVGEIPTSNKFVHYEMVQAGEAVKPDPNDPRPNKRRSHGWPPGEQDVTDALTWLRANGLVPWSWITDETRRLFTWAYAATVTDYLHDRLEEATISPWGEDQAPPIIICETRATAAVFRDTLGDYLCPMIGTGGQVRGILHTEVAPVVLRLEITRGLYVGDLNRAGGDIEGNTRRVLERETERELDWHRVAITKAQAAGITPIPKKDGRDGRWQDSWEAESLGQARLTALVRGALDERLPESLERVHEREGAERNAYRRNLADFNGGAA
jgi:hypothetical protein